MSEWLPIESAPKDAGSVIVFWPHFGDDPGVGNAGKPVVGIARWMRPGSMFLEHWCHEGEWTPWDPTHWMPLPSPPEPPVQS